jgi:MoaA/NifB/PqqE/SkfB family radical SAM enzyme
MGPLKNPRHEAFVHNYLKCGDATKAFELAGYVRDSANAHRLLNRPQVQARIRELQDEIAAKVPITIESLIGELEEVRVAAGSKNQFAAAVRAVLGKAQLAGLLVERQKVEVTDTSALDKANTIEEISLLIVDDALKYKIEPYHDFRPEDREYLVRLHVDSVKQWMDASTKYIQEIRARPLKRVTGLPKSLPSVLNGKSDSQPTTD